MPLERIVDLGGKRFLLLHGHQYYYIDALLYRGEEVHADMVLYGHTHMPDLSADGARLMLNPGSLSRPRTSKGPSVALMTLTDDGMYAELLFSDPR